MFVDPSGKGDRLIPQGTFVYRPEVVHIGGSNGPSISSSWRVDRIRGGSVVLIEKDPRSPRFRPRRAVLLHPRPKSRRKACCPDRTRHRTSPGGPDSIARSTVAPRLFIRGSRSAGSQDARGEIADVRGSRRERVGGPSCGGRRGEQPAVSSRRSPPCRTRGEPRCATSACVQTMARPAGWRSRFSRTGAPAYSDARRGWRAQAARRSPATRRTWSAPRRPSRTQWASSAASTTQSYPTSTGEMTRLTVTLQREASYRIVPDGTTLRSTPDPGGPGRPGTGGRARGDRGLGAERDRPRHSLRAGVRERLRSRRGRSRQHSRVRARPVVGRSAPARAPIDGASRCARADARRLRLPRRAPVDHGHAGSGDSRDGDRDRPLRGRSRDRLRRGRHARMELPHTEDERAAASHRARSHRRQSGRQGRRGGSPDRHRPARREPATPDLPRIETSIHDDDPKSRDDRGEGRRISASSWIRGPRAAALQRPPHRHRSEGRRHPQRPAAPGRYGSRERRHRRRRDRDHHHPHAERAVGPGPRRRSSGEGPGDGAAGEPHSRRPARAASKGAGAQARAAKAGVRADAARDAPHPDQLRAGRRSRSAREGAPLPPRVDRGRRAHQRSYRPRRRRQSQLHRGAHTRLLDTQTAQVLIEARIVEATSKYSRDVGIQWGGDVTFGPATGNPTGVAFPSSINAAGGNYDNNTPTAGISPFNPKRRDAEFAVNLPGGRRAPAPAARSA